LLTAAQLPHLAPLDGLVSGAPAVPASRPSAPAAPGTHPSVPTAPAAPKAAIAPAPEPLILAVTPNNLELSKNAVRSMIPLSNPDEVGALRGMVSDVFKTSPGGLPQTLSSLPHLATALRWEPPILHWCFPLNVRDAVVELERERTNPHLLEALANLLPGLAGIEITFEESVTARPEDQLRSEPAFQALLQASGGEILEVKREPVSPSGPRKAP